MKAVASWRLFVTDARRRAFTLIEMVIVLVVVGVLLALGLPRLDMSRFRADAVAQLVRSTIQTAQRSALTRQHDVLVSFDTAAGKMRIVWDANNDGRVTEGERVQWASLETGNAFAGPARGLDGSAAPAITGSALRTLDDLPTLTLHRNGTSSSAVDIYIGCAAQGAARAFRAVRLTQSTGRTEWFRQGEGGAWIAATL